MQTNSILNFLAELAQMFGDDSFRDAFFVRAGPGIPY